MPLATVMAVMDRSQATPMDRVVFVAIADTMGGDQQCGITTVAAIMGHSHLSEVYVRAAITRIEALGELRIDGGLHPDRDAKQTYHVLIADPPPRPAPVPRGGHGDIPAKVQLQVYRRDNFTCQRCGQPGGDLTVDLVIPYDAGGAVELSNMQTMHRSCNASKGNRV